VIQGNNVEGLKTLVTTYFGDIGPNIDFLEGLPISGLHLDLVRAPHSLEAVLPKISKSQVLSLGVIDGTTGDVYHFV